MAKFPTQFVNYKGPSWRGEKRQFRKSVGRKPDGSQAFFWLGSDQTNAYGLTEVLLHLYVMRAEENWTEEELAKFEEFKRACFEGDSLTIELPMPPELDWLGGFSHVHSSFLGYRPPREGQRIPRPRFDLEGIKVRGQSDQSLKPAKAKPRPTKPVTVPLDEATIRDAVTAFDKMVQQSSRSDRNRYGLVKHLEAIDLPDMPLTKFGFDAISQIIDRQIGMAKKGKCSGHTAKNRCGALRQFIRWLSRTDTFSPKWQSFAEWMNHFTTELKKLGPMIKSRRTARKKANKLNPETLGRLYRAADERLRLCILLACNTGMSNTEIATLTPGMVFWGDRPFIDRDRHKTYVNAKWYLWPETAAMLKSFVGDRQDKKPVFVTSDGNPLVWQRPSGLTIDNVVKQWSELLQRCGIMKMIEIKGRKRVAERGQGFGWTFSFIRKYASDWIRAKYGKEFSEAFLSHADSGISESYTTFSNWEKLGEGIAAMREHFQPLFDEPVEGAASHDPTGT